MEENKETKNTINEEELLKKVEKAAEKGVKKGGFKQSLLSILPVLIAIALLAYFIIPKVELLNKKINGIFHIDDSVADHDATIDNNGIFGYTAADFEEAILGDSSKLKKLEVFKQLRCLADHRYRLAELGHLHQESADHLQRNCRLYG